MSLPPDLCRETVEMSIRYPLSKVLSDDLHLQDWAVLQRTKFIFRDLGQFGRCPANDVQTVGGFWVHSVFRGLSDRHRTRKRAAYSLTDEPPGEGVWLTGTSATSVKERLL